MMSASPASPPPVSQEISTIYELFRGTVNPTPAIREQAEAQLKQASCQPGFGAMLLQGIALATGPADSGIRQACAVFFKNYVEKHWSRDIVSSEAAPNASAFVIPQIDREFIQKHLVEVISAVPNAIQSQLLTCLNRIIRHEFPNNSFQQVTQQALQLLQGPDAAQVLAGLLVTLEVVKYRSSSSDRNLETHLSQIMPSLLSFGQHAISQLSADASTSTPQIHAIMKTIMKCFFVAIRYKFSKHLLADSGNFVAWCTLLIQVLQAPVPCADLQPKLNAPSEDSYTLEKSFFWKMKKWAYRSQNRIASRYGLPKEAKSLGREEGSFAKNFSRTFADQMLQVNLAIISGSGPAPLTDKTLNLFTEYLIVCVREKTTWKILKPHLMPLLGHILFPRLCFSVDDEELWEDDPAEFLKTVFFSFDDFDSVSSACSNFILDAVKARKKDVLPELLSFVNVVLERYAANPQNAEARRQKDGAIQVMGTLSKILIKESGKFGGQMEDFLQSHIVPDLRSPERFLRMRAAWCCEKFAEMTWREPEAAARTLLPNLLACLEDSELPVRAQSCVTIGALLDQPGCQDLLRMNSAVGLGQLVQRTLQLTDQVELDSLSWVMDRLISLFPGELSPFAEQLTIQLRDSFLRILEGSLQADEESPGNLYFSDTDKMMAALAQIETLETVIGQMGEGVAEGALEVALAPLFQVLLQRELVDLLSEGIGLLESLLFTRKSVHESLWPLLGLMLDVLQPQKLPEFFTDFSGALENFISYGMARFAGSPDLMTKLILVIEAALVIESDGYDSETDFLCAIDLMESLLLYGRGIPAISEALIPKFLLLTREHLLKANVSGSDEGADLGSACRVRFVEVVLNSFYAAPVLTLTTLQNQNWLSEFLTIWSQNLSLMRRVHDRRLVLISIASLLHSIPEPKPAALENVLPQLLIAFLEFAREYPKALAEREKLKKEAEEAADDYDNYGGKDEDEDDGEEEDIYNEINDDAEDLNDEAFGNEEGEEEDDEYDWGDEDESDELEEDLYFECPLDAFDFSALIRQTLHDWAPRMSGLTPEQVAFINTSL